jgi:hypothetical protein
MNRTQRRLAARQERRMPQQQTAQPITVDHGHTDTHVVMVFSTGTKIIHFTPEQADQLIEHIKSSKEKLLAHQAAKKAGA